MRSRLFPRHAKTHFYALFALIHAFNILYKVCVKSRKDRRRNHVSKEEIPPRSVRGRRWTCSIFIFGTRCPITRQFQEQLACIYWSIVHELQLNPSLHSVQNPPSSSPPYTPLPQRYPLTSFPPHSVELVFMGLSLFKCFTPMYIAPPSPRGKKSKPTLCTAVRSNTMFP